MKQEVVEAALVMYENGELGAAQVVGIVRRYLRHEKKATDLDQFVRAAKTPAKVKARRKHLTRRRWTAQENKALATEIGIGWSARKIAKVHRRTKKAINARVTHLGKTWESLRQHKA